MKFTDLIPDKKTIDGFRDMEKSLENRRYTGWASIAVAVIGLFLQLAPIIQLAPITSSSDHGQSQTHNANAESSAAAGSEGANHETQAIEKTPTQSQSSPVRDWRHSIREHLSEGLRFVWESLSQGLRDFWEYRGPVLWVGGGLLFVLLRYTGFLFKQSKEPFRYTFSIDDFEEVAGTPGARFSVREADQLKLLRADLTERLNRRVRRFSLLKPDKADGQGARDNTPRGHFQIAGEYALRKEGDDEWILHVWPRIRIGLEGNPFKLGYPVRLPVPTSNETEGTLIPEDYERLVERVYSSIATGIYAQIEVDLRDKMTLFPTSWLRAFARYIEAEDFETSSTIDAYDRALELYQLSLDELAANRVHRCLVWLGVRHRWLLWNPTGIRARMEAEAKTLMGFSRCLVSRSLASGMTGRGPVPVFSTWPKLRDATELLRHCHNSFLPGVPRNLYSRLLNRSGKVPRLGRLNLEPKTDDSSAGDWKASDIVLARNVVGWPLWRALRYAKIRGELCETLAVHALSRSLLEDYAVAELLSELARAFAANSVTDRAQLSLLLARVQIEKSLEAKLRYLNEAAVLDIESEPVMYLLAYCSDLLARSNNDITPTRVKDLNDKYDAVLKINPGNIAALIGQGYLWWVVEKPALARRKFNSGVEIQKIVRQTFVGDLKYCLARVAVEDAWAKIPKASVSELEAVAQERSVVEQARRALLLYEEAIMADAFVASSFRGESSRSDNNRYYEFCNQQILDRYRVFDCRATDIVASARRYGATSDDIRICNAILRHARNDHTSACLNFSIRFENWTTKGPVLARGIEVFKESRRTNIVNVMAEYNGLIALQRMPRDDLSEVGLTNEILGDLLEKLDQLPPAAVVEVIIVVSAIVDNLTDDLARKIKNLPARYLESPKSDRQGQAAGQGVPPVTSEKYAREIFDPEVFDRAGFGRENSARVQLPARVLLKVVEDLRALLGKPLDERLLFPDVFPQVLRELPLEEALLGASLEERLQLIRECNELQVFEKLGQLPLDRLLKVSETEDDVAMQPASMRSRMMLTDKMVEVLEKTPAIGRALADFRLRWYGICQPGNIGDLDRRGLRDGRLVVAAGTERAAPKSESQPDSVKSESLDVMRTSDPPEKSRPSLQRKAVKASVAPGIAASPPHSGSNPVSDQERDNSEELKKAFEKMIAGPIRTAESNVKALKRLVWLELLELPVRSFVMKQTTFAPFADDLRSSRIGMLLDDKRIDWCSFGDDEVFSLISFATLWSQLGDEDAYKASDSLCSKVVFKDYFPSHFNLHWNLGSRDPGPNAEEVERENWARHILVTDRTTERWIQWDRNSASAMNWRLAARQRLAAHDCPGWPGVQSKSSGPGNDFDEATAQFEKVEWLCNSAAGFHDLLASANESRNESGLSKSDETTDTGKSLNERRAAYRLDPDGRNLDLQSYRESLLKSVAQRMVASRVGKDPPARFEALREVAVEFAPASISELGFEAKDVPGELQNMISTVRESLSTYGFVLPGIRFRDNPEFGIRQFRIVVCGTPLPKETFRRLSSQSEQWQQLIERALVAASMLYNIHNCQVMLDKAESGLARNFSRVDLADLMWVIRILIREGMLARDARRLVQMFQRSRDDGLSLTETLEVLRASPVVDRKIVDLGSSSAGVHLFRSDPEIEAEIEDAVGRGDAERADLRCRVRSMALDVKLEATRSGKKRIVLVTSTRIKPVVAEMVDDMDIRVLSYGDEARLASAHV